MIILILALLFGAAVLYFTAKSLKSAKANGSPSKIIYILKAAVLVETIIYLILFVLVFLRTLIM